MKLKYTEGCICDSLTIDGVETIDMNVDDFKSVLHKLLDRETDICILQSVFMNLMSSQGNYECSDKPCESCGDYVTTYTLEL